jgi:hypothetical protein
MGAGGRRTRSRPIIGRSRAGTARRHSISQRLVISDGAARALWHARERLQGTAIGLATPHDEIIF